MPETDPKNLNYVITPIMEAIFFCGGKSELRNYVITPITEEIFFAVENLNYLITPITEEIFFGGGNELRNYNLNYVITLGLRIFQANTPITQLRNYTVTKNSKPSTCLASGDTK